MKSLQKVDVPEGKRGGWEVRKFDVTEEYAQLINLHYAINASRYASDRRIIPGRYTGLYYKNRYDPIMSDTPAEMRDHASFVERASGDVLITGLGLGLCVKNLLLKKSVRSVTVVELDPDVIELVSPCYAGPRVRVVQADAFAWRPSKAERWDFAWHDVWPDICADNLPHMKKLVARYRSRCAWQGCWAFHDTLRLSRR